MNNTYTKLLDRMVWLNAKQGGEDATSQLKVKSFITITRDPGSGGKPIAEVVAKKLKMTFYDQMLLDEIARSTKSRRDVLEAIDEKTRSKAEDFIHSVLNPEYISERRYIKHLLKVTYALAYKKKAVFLGRGTNFILPNAYGLHVRVTAPYRVRVSRAVQFEKVNYKRAREIIRKVSRERAEFVKQYFGKDLTNAKYYDLTINTTYMTLDDAADLIIKAFENKTKQIS